MLREGDQVNFFRVMDRGDGTLTPVAESLSACSKRESREGTDDEPNGFGGPASNGADEDSSDESNASATRRGPGFRAKRHAGATSLTAAFHRHDVANQSAAAAASSLARLERLENEEATSAQALHHKMRMLQQQMDQMRLNRRLGHTGLGGGRKLAPLSLPASNSQKLEPSSSDSAVAVRPSLLSATRPPEAPGTSTGKSAFGLHVPQPPSGVPPSSRVRPLPPGMIRLPPKPPSPSSTGATKAGLLPALPEGQHVRTRPTVTDQLSPVLLATRGAGMASSGVAAAAAARHQRCFYCHRKIGLANTYQCR